MMTAQQIVEGFLSFLTSRKLDYLLEEIVVKLKDQLEARQETAYVTSAVVLTSRENIELESFLKKEFGKNLKIELKIDPGILGGLKIIVGDQMIDQTVLGKLSSIVSKIEN